MWPIFFWRGVFKENQSYFQTFATEIDDILKETCKAICTDANKKEDDILWSTYDYLQHT